MNLHTAAPPPTQQNLRHNALQPGKNIGVGGWIAHVQAVRDESGSVAGVS